MTHSIVISRTFAATLLLASLTACGGNNPGGGTGTLQVIANVTALNSVNNAMTTTQFGTAMVVRVTRAGAPVTDAVVTITSSCGNTTVAPTGDVVRDGSYRATQNGYCRTYTLDVVAGSDRVVGATVVGPEPHIFASPVVGTSHNVANALRVQWSPGGAGSATIETRDLNETAIMDNGAYEIPGASLRSRAGRMEDERVRVNRRNQVMLNGGAAGSLFGVTVSNGVDFVTVTQ